MKKLLTTAAILVFLLMTAGSAQTTFDLGIKGGGIRAKMSGKTTIDSLVQALLGSIDANAQADPDARIGLFGGVFLSINLNGPFSIQPELLYSVKGLETKYDYAVSGIDNVSTLKINLTYLEIPVLIKYNFPTEGKIQPSLYVGPALSFNLDGTFKTVSGAGGNDPLKLGKVNIANAKSTDFSGVFGGELGLAAGKVNLVLDVRYTHGFTKAFKDANFQSSRITNNEWAFVDFATDKADDLKNRGVSIAVGLKFPLGGGGGSETGQ